MRNEWATSDGRVRCIYGDCTSIMPSLPPHSALITDIPYNEVNRESGGIRNFDKGIADSAPVHIPDLLPMFVRAADTIYVWCGTRQAGLLREGLIAAGLSTRLCVWEKTDPSPVNGEYLWLSSIECCVFGKKSGAVFNARCQSPVWRLPRVHNGIHPTQKPVELMVIQVMASTRTNDGVLDPFMGSGTTGVACIRTGRRFTGIENNRQYFEMAVARMQHELGLGYLSGNFYQNSLLGADDAGNTKNV